MHLKPSLMRNISLGVRHKVRGELPASISQSQSSRVIKRLMILRHSQIYQPILGITWMDIGLIHRSFQDLLNPLLDHLLHRTNPLDKQAFQRLLCSG